MIYDVDFRRLICNNAASTFILWLALRNSLMTKDRLNSWNVGTTDSTCPLCNNAIETVQHLFFKCPYAAKVWTKSAAAHDQYVCYVLEPGSIMDSSVL